MLTEISKAEITYVAPPVHLWPLGKRQAATRQQAQ